VKNVLQALFLALVASALAQAVWQHDRLPERVATHFNAAGEANGWMSRDGQTAWHIGAVLFIAGLLEGIAWLSPRLPAQYINLPHRDYWLAPERRAATQAWLAGLTLGLGCAIILFFIGLFHLVYRANLAGSVLPVVPVGLLSLGLLLTVGFVILGVLARFARPPA
jgi:Na+/proline symporter